MALQYLPRKLDAPRGGSEVDPGTGTENRVRGAGVRDAPEEARSDNENRSANEASATRRAELVAELKGGAAIIKITADDETGEVSEARVLARFGDVPDDLDQMVNP